MIIESPPLNPAASADKVFDWKHDSRAIGWISALSKDGGTNLAPISVFSPAGRGLPTVRISLRSRSDGVTLILTGDGEDGYVIDAEGGKIKLLRGSSDAALMPYHVERSKLFVMDRIGKSRFLDAARISRAIEFTRVFNTY